MHIYKLVVLALAATLALPVSAAAHDGAHKMMGTVTMAAKDHVMMKTQDGKELTIAVTEKTKVLKGKTPMKVEEITEGTRIVVTVKGHKAPYTASQIDVGVAAEKK